MINEINFDNIDITSGIIPETEPERQYYYMALCRKMVKA